MFRKIGISISIAAFSLGFAQNIDKQKLDHYFSALDENHKVMGSFAIADKGKVVYTHAIGFCDAESQKKADVNTIYRIGSITKTFTAVLIMKAVEEKKLTLDTQLSKFFPRIKNTDKIKIEYLLNHRSGIHSYTDDKEYMSYYTQPITKEKLIEIIEKGGSDFEPDTQFQYSNSNYTILTYILEKVYGKKYSELIEKYIAKPLQLQYTQVGGKIDVSKNNAYSYGYENGKYIKSPETDMSVPSGAGCLISTPTELITFMNGLTSGKLVSKESFDAMRQFKDHYGFALVEVPFGEKKGFGHTGGIDEFRSVLYYFPDGEKTIAMITNQSDFDNNQMAIVALQAAYGRDFQIPDFKVVEVSAADLEPLTGNYSSSTVPLKINVFIKDKKLMAQASGQSAFPLEATSKTNFTFDAAGIEIDFNPAKKEFVISQGGTKNTFTKE